MNSTAIIVLIMIAIVVGAFLGSRFRFLRATRQIMQLFHRANAFDIQNAVKPGDVGIVDRPFYMRMGMRDYKIMAFQNLVQANIIQTLDTEEGSKYYVSRENYERIIAKR